MEEKRLYEMMFVMDINRTGTEERMLKRVIHPIIEKHGGEVVLSRKWADYEFAYPIKKLTRGAYHLVYAKLPPNKVRDIKRDCYLKEEILRVLFLCAKEVPQKLVLSTGEVVELKETSEQDISEQKEEERIRKKEDVV
ncbi:MAG: 30S ribosomal protein S6 [Planctomycetota bacterium]|nr:30S ribosomal protein S6 [Planctomycetota bacterium]